MRKHYYLTNKEKETIISKLTYNQLQSLKLYSKLSKESYFANILASYKGTQDYSFDGYLDHGCVNDNIKCLCGKSLRYEFSLKNNVTGEKISLGSTHFQRELNIPKEVAK